MNDYERVNAVHPVRQVQSTVCDWFSRSVREGFVLVSRRARVTETRSTRRTVTEKPGDRESGLNACGVAVRAVYFLAKPDAPLFPGRADRARSIPVI